MYNDFENQVAKALCENDHLFFTRYFFKARQSIKFRVNWHHHLICDALQEVIDGRTKNLVINVAPGSSKTEIVVINFIARGLALNPRARFLHLSGSDSLASLNSATAREIIRSDDYQQFWPLQIADDAKAKKRWNVLVDGQPAGGVYATSLGGQITGFRAGHMTEGFTGCFVAGTGVLTNKGTKVIDEIKPGDKVLSFNHENGQLEFQPVLAVKESIREEIVEVQTTGGRNLRCTPCHRFFDGKSYKAISEFNAGELLTNVSWRTLVAVQKMRKDFSARQGRDTEIHQPTSDTNILFTQLLVNGCERIKSVAEITGFNLPNLFRRISTSLQAHSNLFFKMCQSSAFTSHAWRGKFKLEREEKGLPNFISEVKAANPRARWTGLFDLFGKEKFISSSSRSQYPPQRASESCDTVQVLPYDSSSLAQDAIYSITALSAEKTKVYDIQVAQNHNFFAKGILVHNCIIIDDPIKADEAFSQTKLDAANRKLVTTVNSRRANPAVPIVLVMQRIAESDPTGFIEKGNLDGEWKSLKIPALIDDAYVNSLPEKYRAMVEKVDHEDAAGRFSYWQYKEPLEKLLSMERGDGTDATGSRVSRHVFSGQYQQNPKALGGNIIKGHHFIRYTVLPKIRYRQIYADTAQKTREANDYSVFEEWGLGEDNKLYLLDLIRGKWEAPELKRRAVAFWAKAKARDSVAFGQLRDMQVEDKSSGTGLIQELKLAPHNIPIKPIERDKDKLTRVMDILSYIEVGLVHVPESAPFTNDFISECESFTADDSHDFDDQVDPMVDAVKGMLSSLNKMLQWAQLGEAGIKEKNEKIAPKNTSSQNIGTA